MKDNGDFRKTMTESSSKIVRLPKVKQPPQRQKNGQDARRFRLIMEWIKNGTCEFTLAGTKIEPEDSESLVDVIDQQVKELDAEKQRERMRMRRSKGE
jgi:hypothetical protein